MPNVSVIMSVYNGEKFISEAIKSILNQTLTDFEVIVINDGSTDSTPEILKHFCDRRLRIIEQSNKGLTMSLNRGIRAARGEFIARMDADDLSEPTRLARELEVLDGDTSLAVVGSWYTVIDNLGREIARCRRPGNMLWFTRMVGRVNPLCHGSVMMRRRAIEAVGLYEERIPYAQDYDLWLRMFSRGFRFQVIPEYLYRYRFSPESVAKAHMQMVYAGAIKETHRNAKALSASLRSVQELRLSDKQKDALFHYRVGMWKLNDGDLHNARQEFLKSIRVNPADPRPWYGAAVSFLPRKVRDHIANWVGGNLDYVLRQWNRWARGGPMITR